LSKADLLRHFTVDFKNQIIYTTHSPFMVPTDNLDAIRTVSIEQDSGTTVSNDPTGDSRTLFPIQAALGYSMSQSIFLGANTLIIKGDMTQSLNFTDTPLVVALLNKSLGKDLTSEWLPVLPPNPQSPYYPGPYGLASIAPIQTMRSVSDAEAETAGALYQRLAALPAGFVARGGASNNWAVAPAKSTTGGALLASPEIAGLITQLETTRWTGRPGYPIRAMVGLALVKSLYTLPTWTRTVSLVRDHAALRDVLGAVPSVDAASRFTIKLRAHGDMLAACINDVIAALRAAKPEMGETVAIDGSDLPAYANGQRYVSRGGALRERFADPDATWGHRSSISTRSGGGYYGYKVP